MKNENSYFGGLIQGVSSLLVGMKTTIKVFFRAKTTEQYPENRAELKMFDRFRGELIMPHNENNEHRCVACGLCQTACPNDTIEVVSEMIETEEGKKKKILTPPKRPLKKQNQQMLNHPHLPPTVIKVMYWSSAAIMSGCEMNRM